jgi:hypothetical protein
MICQHHLPFIADRVIYLSLCDGNETPGQINLFFSYIPSIDQFTHLQSLKLLNGLIYNTGNVRHYQTDQDQFFKNRSQVSDITVD